MFTSTPPRYTSPPGGYSIRFTSTPATPANGYKYSYTNTPSSKDPYKAHRRHNSHQGPTATTYTYSPQPTTYFASPGYGAGGYFTPTSSVPRQPDFVSAKDNAHSKTRRTAEYSGSKQRTTSARYPYTYTTTKEQSYRFTRAGREGLHDDEGYCSGSTPPPEHKYDAHAYPVTDHFGSPQAAGQKRSADSPKNKSSSSTRQRSHSFSAHQTSTPSSRPRASSKVKTPPKATAADAARAHIPAGYSYKNWDPTEEPILLLGSVFDANSLGKWIYDWTVYHHGAATPMSDLAGDLWLLLIQLAGKIKRAEECVDRIRDPDERDLVEEFLESGERLWSRFSKILKACEEYMWRAASKEAKKKGTNASASMGARSGCEFVDSIFGRDRKLEDTEKLKTGMRLWSMRFDANCEEILRNPSG